MVFKIFSTVPKGQIITVGQSIGVDFIDVIALFLRSSISHKENLGRN